MAPCSHAQQATGRLITSAAIAVDPATHKVYAADERGNAVIVTDERTGKRVSVPVGKAPIALAILPALNRVYVVNADSNSISILDGRSETVIATLAGGSHPYTIAADQTTAKVYVTYTYDHILTVIDCKTNTASTLSTGSADGIAIDERTNTLFLSTYEDPNIRIVDAATGAMRKVAVGPHIWGMLFDAQSSTLYLAHTATADVLSLNEKTMQTARIPVGHLPCALAENLVTHRLYAVNYDDRTLSVIDTNTSRVLATLPVGDHPQAVIADPRSNRVYVANVHGDSVTVIDGAKNAIVATEPAGENPYALAVDPDHGNVYAAIYGAQASVPVTQAALSQ